MFTLINVAIQILITFYMSAVTGDKTVSWGKKNETKLISRHWFTTRTDDNGQENEK